MERTININFKRLADKLIVVGKDISKEKLSFEIQALLLEVLSKATHACFSEIDEPGKITVDIELKKPDFKDSVKIVTDPDTGERYGHIPFEHTHEFQIMELTKILKDLGDGSYTVTIVPKKRDNGASESQLLNKPGTI